MLQAAIDVLLRQVDESVKTVRFSPLLEGIRQVFEDNGVSLDRIQMPMTKNAGFRHPLYWAVIVTWTRDHGFADSFVIHHDEMRAREAQRHKASRPRYHARENTSRKKR